MFSILLVSAIVSAAPKQTAHIHGHGTMDIAFDGNTGKIHLEIPGESIFGFEHQAKSKKDVQKKEAALKKLEDKISEMVVFEAALNCKIAKDIFEVNQEVQHADVDAEFSVTCDKPVLGSSISFNFPKVFSKFSKIKVNIVVDSVQKTTQVTKNGESVELK